MTKVVYKQVINRTVCYSVYLVSSGSTANVRFPNMTPECITAEGSNDSKHILQKLGQEIQ